MIPPFLMKQNMEADMTDFETFNKEEDEKWKFLSNFCFL